MPSTLRPRPSLLLALLALCLGAATTAGAIPVTFQYVPDAPQQHVYLAGSFNQWSPTALEMQRGDDGVYRATVDLAPGRYPYKFVLDGNTWREDPFAPDGYADDGYGGRNGIVVVPDGVEKLTVGRADGAAPAPPAAAPSGGGEAVTGLRKVTFRYQPPIGGVRQVMLAGTFNDWNVGATPMQDADGDGIWEVTLMLVPGDYQYKFVADGNWITDEHADDFAPDGFGGRNSVIHVDARFGAIEVARGDGKFYLDDIVYTLDYGTVNPVSATRLVFTARAHLDDVEAIHLLYSEADGPEREVPMRRVGEDPALEYRRVAVDRETANAPVRFVFKYTDGGQSRYVGPAGAADVPPPAAQRFLYTVERLPVFAVPDWVGDGVIYQIFPERFANGDPGNDPDFSEPMYAGRTTLPPGGKTNGEYFHLVRDWYDIGGLVRSPYRTDGKPDYYSFYGGDIEGVRQKLPYLADLGVTILYFNPLNVARSNHKYDPCDYRKIDPHFADETTFKRFVREAHDHGIRILVDMAYNHSGDCNPYFEDSWKRGPESPYYTWFEWKRWPPPAGVTPSTPGFKADDYYACWWGFGIHPDLNYDLQRPQQDENAIRDPSRVRINQPLVDWVLSSVDYWLGDMDIDGFRLDVPNEVPFWFWAMFRERVRAVKPDAYLVGEIWGNASEWIRPDVFDATMNYKFFRDPVQKFLGQGQGSAEAFDRELAPGRWQYPLQAVEAQMNLVDSHDTIRYATLVGGDRKRQALTALFAMTYVGAPHIYYGDEIGLEGGKDPDCRRPFPWRDVDQPERAALRAAYKKAIALRHAHAALRRGSFRSVLTDGMLYGYLREGGAGDRGRDGNGERLLVVLNAGRGTARARVALATLGVRPGRFRDLWNGGEVVASGETLEIPLAGLSGAVLELPRAASVAERP